MVVKVFTPWDLDPKHKPNAKFNIARFRAPSKNGFSDNNIHDLLMKFADEIDTRYKGHEYNCVRIAPSAYNFVWTGLALEKLTP